MTIEGAIVDLQNLIDADGIPFWAKPSLQKVKETVEDWARPCFAEEVKEGQTMKQIKENDVCLYDGILLIVADVEWDEAGMPTRFDVKKLYPDAEHDKEPITFKKIREMFPTSHSIIAICDTALHGEIYRFGNYGESWYQYGTTMGYA